MFSFDDFHAFFIQNVLRLIQDQEQKAQLARVETWQEPDRQDTLYKNSDFLQSLYVRVAEGRDSIEYFLMTSLLQTIIPTTSSCFEILVSINDPRKDHVNIEEAVVAQGHIMKVR